MSRFVKLITIAVVYVFALSYVPPIYPTPESTEKTEGPVKDVMNLVVNTASTSDFQSELSGYSELPQIAPETSPYEPEPDDFRSSEILQDTLRSWDLRDTTRIGQLTVISTESDGGQRGFQVAAGDINGDDHVDLVISGLEVSALGRDDCGGAYVFYGPRSLSSTLRFTSSDVKIYGPSSNAEIQGLAVDDVNGDGVDDIVLGATGVDEIYLILGKSSLPSTIDLSTTFDCLMTGIEDDRTGSSISLGDVNADGLKDILISAPLGDGPGGTRRNSGSYYLVYGRSDWPSNISLTTETTIYGAEDGDGVAGSTYYPGMQIVSGDINGDGFDDILIGAPGADGLNNSRSECGEAYAVFGDSALANTIDLAIQADLICYGIDRDDHIVRLGSGDVNGDSIDDLLIGARDADGRYNVLPDAGEIYVVYGRTDFPDTMDMSTHADVTIFGTDQGDVLGRIVAQDVNGDGVSDLLLGAPDADGPDNSRNDCGEAYLLYGHELPPVIELRTYAHHIIYGADAGDGLTGYGSFALEDVDEDGIADLIIGAYYADGFGNDYSRAGEAYVVSGFNLAGYAVDVAVTRILEPMGEIRKDVNITPSSEIRNLGLETETFPVNFEIGADYSETATVTLTSGEIDTVTFPVWKALDLGTYAVRCSTALVGDENPTNDEKMGTVIVTTGPEPVIYDVSPNRGGNTGLVTVEISGANFEAGATVKLTKTGQPDIVVDTSVTTVVDSSEIVATFDLRGQEPGAWNVVVRNPDGNAATFYSGYIIELGIEMLWVDVVGRDQLRLGEEGTYWINFGNSGNVDAYDLLLEICIPKNSVYSIDFPNPPDTSIDWDYVSSGAEVDTNVVIPIWILKLSSNSYYDFRLFITITDGQIGDTFPIRVELNEAPRSEFSNTGNIDYIESSPIFNNLALSVWESLPEWTKYQSKLILFQDEETVRQVLSDNLNEIWPFFPTFTIVGAGMGTLAGLCFGNPLLGGISGALLGQAVDQAIFIFHFKIKEIEMALKGLSQIDIELQRSWDPNDKVGPIGFSETHFVLSGQTFQYIVYFENVDTATAPALDIVITDTLDTDLDWTTLTLGQTIHTPTTIDTSNGVITWTFNDINLPPNVNPPEGEGWVSFTIKPKQDLLSGTEIKNEAWIVFDDNEPMSTGEVLNTIDALPPTSNILSLEQEQPLSGFEVRWSGEDDESGSGVRDYSVYVSDNGSPYAHWITTDSTSAIFTGEDGHTYSFYSVARDNVGHMESAPTDPDVITTVTLHAGIAVSPNPFVPARGHTQISFFGAGLPFSKIKVYNKAGELVRSLEERAGEDRLDWDATSDNGNNLASGVYIWVSMTPEGNKEKGKFAIIK